MSKARVAFLASRTGHLVGSRGASVDAPHHPASREREHGGRA
jgi:hypothetical protein